MFYNRLDNQCKARVLAVTGERVLIQARWPASKRDEKYHAVNNGMAVNNTIVSREYFKRRYGTEPLVG